MMLGLFAQGLGFGVLHVLLGPDHLAGLAPLSVDAGRGAWRVGLRWGIGHALGIVLVGMLAYGAGDQLGLNELFEMGNSLTGLILIGIGAWGFLHLRRDASHFGHADSNHHGATHATHVHTRAALLIGAVHGLVGTGATLGVLPALMQESWTAALTLLLGFSFGTIVSMLLFAALLGLAGPKDASAAGPTYRWIFILASTVALMVGLIWLLAPIFGWDIHGHA